MAKKNKIVSGDTLDNNKAKAELQRRMARTRESLAETVGEIKDTVEQQVELVKDGVSSVLNYRDEFQKDPLVWSLGALSAGFALGYTVGYAHKNAKGSKQKGQMAEFANTMLDQLSGVGQAMVLPALETKMSELFGVDFSAVLGQIGGAAQKPAKKSSARMKALPKPGPASRKKPSTKKKS